MTTLLVMRYAEMVRVHPQIDLSRVCSKCGEQVGIYPSGQDVVRRDPQTVIVCTVCLPPGGVLMPAPGALEETKESVLREPPAEA